MAETIYLETTAAIDAAFKAFPELLKIIESSDKSLSSQYVKMEIKKGFLYNLVLLHNKAVECDTFAQIQQFVSNLASSPRRYYLGTALDAIRVFFEKIDSKRPEDLIEKYGNIPMGVINKRETINFLRSWIRMLLSRVDRMVDEIINPMGCFVDIKSPVLKGDLFDNRPAECQESAHECHILRFFSENGEDFEKILNKLKALPDDKKDAEIVRRISSLNRIMKKKVRRASSRTPFSNKSQDEQMCWACSDAIHAVLVPKGASVVNRNGRHYDPICESIGRKSLVYKSPKI